MAKVAFLGLGVMGYPMAGHLLKKGGHDVTVYNRSAAKAQQWVKEYGGKSAATPAEAAKDCDFVMMCVGNDDDVRSVVYGDKGALAGMKKGSILVDAKRICGCCSAAKKSSARRCWSRFSDRVLTLGTSMLPSAWVPANVPSLTRLPSNSAK